MRSARETDVVALQARAGRSGALGRQAGGAVAVLAGIGVVLIVAVPFLLLDDALLTRHVRAVSGAILIASLVGGALLSTILHEFGHLVGGWLAGWRAVFVQVGPVRYWRQAERSRVSLSWTFGWTMAGCALCAPDEWKDWAQYRRGALFTLAGGPLGSAVVSCVAGVVALRDDVHAAVGALAGFTALFSALTAIVQSLPISGEGLHRTDAARWGALRRARSGDGAVETHAALTFAWSKAPAQWYADLLDVSARHADTLDAKCTAVLLFAGRCNARANVAEAERVLGLQRPTTARQAEALADMRVVQRAVWPEHAARADGRTLPLPMDEVPRCLVHAATALSRGDAGAATVQLARAAKLWQRAPIPVAYVHLRPAIEALTARVQEMRS